MYKEPTDMRFGINSLSGLVRNKLGFDPMNGDKDYKKLYEEALLTISEKGIPSESVIAQMTVDK